MYLPTAQQRSLLEQADYYRQAHDDYHSVKLYRLLVKQAPEWLLPYQRLATIYKKRREWKAVVHYNKKAVVIDPAAQHHWWDLGIGTYAIGKPRQAQRIWNKFGWSPNQLPPIVSVQLQHHGILELVWVKPLNPVAGIIVSVPHPLADRAFKDKILFDHQAEGFHVGQGQKYPVLPELDLLKRSHYLTFSGIVRDCTEQDLLLFEQLANQQGMGFAVWSNAAYGRQLPFSKPTAEFYSGQTVFSAQLKSTGSVVALAGKTPQQIHALINAWKVITLKEINTIERH